MRIICPTSDVQDWALRPFMHLFRKYWNDTDPVTIGGFTPPAFPLLPGFEFHSIGPFADYPRDKWSDGIIDFLAALDDELILWLMDDFWLSRFADVRSVHDLATYMHAHHEVTRIDLAADRLYAANAGDVGSFKHLDLIACHLPVPYHFSFQAGLWRRRALLAYMERGESPARAELNGTARMNEDRAIVLGTRQWPVRYLIAVQFGKLALDGGYQTPAAALRPDDLEAVKQWIPEHIMQPEPAYGVAP